MAFVRTAYLALHETHHQIGGKLTIHTMESMDGTMETETIDFHFYRPGSAVNDKDWAKDLLVQVIEQL